MFYGDRRDACPTPWKQTWRAAASHLVCSDTRMSVKVKICGITNVPDGLAAAEAGADMVGLMFYERSPRHLSFAIAAEISRALPSFIVRVGVFVNPAEDVVMRAISECGVSLLQFHGEEAPEFCTQFGVMSMKAFRVRNEESLTLLPSYQTDAWLLDAFSPDAYGGTGAKFNWDLATEAKLMGRPIFLAGGLTPENVGAAVRQVQPFGVDVSSGVESAPGTKDHAKVRAFIQAARELS
jgi:phosphoribosylanthranilate isomerase